MKLSEQELRKILKVKNKTANGKDLICYCPSCGKPEFGISLTKDYNPYNCFRKKHCGISGHIYDLFRFLGINTYKESKRVSTEDSETLRQIIELSEHKEIFLPEIKFPLGFRRTRTDDYLLSRGYIEKDFEDYVVGRTNVDPSFQGMAIIGIKQKGRLVAFISRSSFDKDYCKKHKLLRYKNSETDFASILDGLDEINGQKEAILVEGHFDRINVKNKLGLPNKETVVLATFGAKISQNQIFLLKESGIKRIISMHDSDVPLISEKNTSKLIGSFDSIKISHTPEFEEDPGDMDENKIRTSLKKTTNFYKFKISNLKKI
jgi:DNA primase